MKDCLSLEKNILLYGRRVVLQKQVLDLLHQNHPGIVRSKMLVRSYVYWIGIDNNIEKLIATCLTCHSTQNKEKDKIHISWLKY